MHQPSIQITPARSWVKSKVKVQATCSTVSSSATSRRPRVTRKRARARLSPSFCPYRSAPAPATHRYARAVAQHEHRVAGVGLQLTNTIDVDDGTTMRADEPTPVEPALEEGERLPHEMPPAARMDRGVVIVGLDPVDLVRLE